jgi:small nuclear ribonucleoprotein (snRNP)-like protein
MAYQVDRLVDKFVMLMTNDGRIFKGLLKSFD